MDERVHNNYPFPIAAFYTRYCKAIEQNDPRIFEKLKDLLEVVFQFLSIIALSDYQKHHFFSEEINKLIAQRFARPLTLGSWFDFLEIILREFIVQNHSFFVPELENVFFQRTRAKKPPLNKVIQQFKEFTQFRNVWAHDKGLDKEEIDNLVEQWGKVLIHFIENELSFLSNYDIVTVFEEEGILNQSIWRGVRSKTLDNTLSLEPNATYLVQKNTHNYLNLLPLSFLEPLSERPTIKEVDFLCLMEGTVLDKQRVKRLKYLRLGNELQVTTKEIRSGELDNFYELKLTLLEFLDKLPKEFLSRKNFYQPVYFTEQRQLIKQYLDSYVHRTSVYQWIQQILSEQHESTIVITAPPGQGKTALSCYMVDEHNWVHHFVSRSESRDTVISMMQSLIEQIWDQYGYDQTPVNENNLFRYFKELVSGLPQEENLYIVIDGIDEFPNSEHDNLERLIATCPKNLKVLMLGRPVKWLKRLPTTQVYLHPDPIPPLNIEEFIAIATQYEANLTHAQLHEIYTISKGNPLYLRKLLESISLEFVDLSVLPRDITTIYQNILSHLYDDDGSQACYDVLGILLVSQKSLSIKELKNILPQHRPLLVRTIDNLLPLLLRLENSYTFAHKSCFDFLLTDEDYGFTEDEVKTFHRKMVDYLEPWQKKKLEYGYDYLVYHYSQLEDAKGIISLLSEEDETMRNATINYLKKECNYLIYKNKFKNSFFENTFREVENGDNLLAQENTALIWFLLCKNEEALNIFLRLENNPEVKQNRLLLTRVCSHLSMLCKSFARFDDGYKYSKKGICLFIPDLVPDTDYSGQLDSIQFCNEQEQDALAKLFYHTGRLYYDMKLRSQARFRYAESLYLFQKIGNEEGILASNSCLAMFDYNENHAEIAFTKLFDFYKSVSSGHIFYEYLQLNCSPPLLNEMWYGRTTIPNADNAIRKTLFNDWHPQYFSLEWSQNLGYSEKIRVMFLNNVGVYFLIQDELDNAKICFNELLQYAENKKDSYLIAVAKNNLAINMALEGENESALMVLQEAYQCAEKMETVQGQGETLINWYVIDGQNNTKLLEQAHQFLETVGFQISIIHIQKLLEGTLIGKQRFKPWLIFKNIDIY